MSSPFRVISASALRLLLPALVCAATLFQVSPLQGADGLRVLPPGELPKDRRLEPLKDLNGYFPFEAPTDPKQWEERAARLRRQLSVTLGLWPMPTRTPLHAVIHGRIDLGDYTVEKVYFESVPGFHVTGNLYRPNGRTGPLPAVLSPHGHWNDGRFMDAGLQSVRQEISQGAERFEDGGRSPLQSRCAQLARMGCVVFHYDMIGYADSQQIPQSLAHGFSKQRPEMNAPENWGLFSPQAESHYQSVMGLQTWNSIRALDFLESLPDVDPKRIAVTGASGGGTQTFLLCALDPRPAVAFPAVMVSTGMQGGCTCENASGLRVETGNVEIAALFAPKPLGMTAANDWTKEMESKGFPELLKHYTRMGVPSNVGLTALTHFGHNYNYVSRSAMYRWMNKQLKLGLTDPIVEEAYQRLGKAELSVWDSGHPAPPSGPEFERALLRRLTRDAQEQLDRAAQSVETFQKVVGGGVDIVIGRNLDEVGSVEMDMTEKTDRGQFLQMSGLLRNRAHGEELPVVFLHPKEWKGRTVIWIDEAGKSGLFDETGAPRGEVRRLLAAGVSVVGVDLLFQGEFLPSGKPVLQTRWVDNPREAAGYTFGYNHSLFAQRVHDVLSLIRYVRDNERASTVIDLVGLKGAGPWVAAARARAGRSIDRAVVDTGGFRFGNVRDLRSPDFLPGAAKFGDLPGMLALGAPGKLWLAGEGEEAPELTATIYENAGNGQTLEVYKGEAAATASSAVRWLLDRP
jgi:dienelactone hydrolase